jgi:uncharacterized membrane protein
MEDRDASYYVSSEGHQSPIFSAVTWLSIITLIGAAARLITLGDQSLWMDEFATVYQSRILERDGFLALTRSDHVSPFYYIVTVAMIKLGASGEFWLRFPAAISGVLCVPVSYMLTMRMFHARSLGLFVALIVAISPLAIWHAQDARMYSTLLLVSMLLIYLSWPAVNRELNVRGCAALTVCTILGLYVHHYLALISMSFGFFLIYTNGIRNREFWMWVATQAIAAMCFMPWLLLTYINSSSLTAGTTKPLIAMWIPYTLYTFVGGYSLGPAVGELKTGSTIQVLMANKTVIAVAGLAATAAFYSGVRQLWHQNRTATLWCVTLLFAPMLLETAITLFGGISYNVRYMIGAYPALAIIFAGAALLAKERNFPAIISVAFLAALTVLSLLNWYTLPRYAKEDVRAAASLASELTAEDTIWVASSSQICNFIAYYQVTCPESTISVNQHGDNLDYALGELDEHMEGDLRELLLLEYRTWTGDPKRRVRRQIESGATLISSESWGPELTVSKFLAGRQTELSETM